MSIKVDNLTYIYHRDFTVLNDINFHIKEGEFVGVLGKNGAGKSTLLDILIGFKYPAQGQIVVNGVDIFKNGSHAPDLVYMSQDLTLKGDISVREFLKFNRFFYPNYKINVEEELIKYFELKTDVLIGSLSTGQQRKVQIIAGLAADTKIILIDEITAVLDPEARILFFNKLMDLNQKENKTIVLATNIYEDLKNRVAKIFFIKDSNLSVIEGSGIQEMFNVWFCTYKAYCIPWN